MTELRLVADNGQLTVPVGQLDDIAAAAHAFADAVESGDLNPETVIVCTVVDGLAEFTCFGPSPSVVEAVGLLDLIKARIIQGSFQ